MTHLRPLVVAATLLIPVPAPAQDATAPREGDIWGGKEHVLPRAELHAQEKAAGVALPPAERRSQDEEVEQLERQVMQGAHEGPGAPDP